MSYPPCGAVRRRLLLAAAGGCVGLLPHLSTAQAKVLLSVTGLVDPGNTPAGTDFDLATLDALPQHSFVTATPWFTDKRRFSGPLLRNVLAAAGAKPQARLLLAVALNNYKIEMPVDDSRRYDVIVASRLDDKPMSVRDKGPLFIVYPFHEHAKLRSERYYSRSAWQLRRLELKA